MDVLKALLLTEVPEYVPPAGVPPVKFTIPAVSHIELNVARETVGKGFTVTVIVCVLAHCPAVGVKVYVVVDVLLIAGDQVPLIPLFDVLGRLIFPPAQTADN
jgi:hypothetical protein